MKTPGKYTEMIQKHMNVRNTRMSHRLGRYSRSDGGDNGTDQRQGNELH